MRTSAWQQLEAFASWHQQALSTPQGKALWGVDRTIEERLMNQAPLYVLDRQSVDFYAEAVLLGRPRVDLSAQYRADVFYEGNPLIGRSVGKEGDFFHYYARELGKRKPSLLPQCMLYLEADIGEGTSPDVSSFINLSGDFVADLLPLVLKYRKRSMATVCLLSQLQRVRPWGEPWHIGFMEAREEKPLRLVLLLHHGLSDIPNILKRLGTSAFPKEGWQLLEDIDKNRLFYYMLDLDVFPDGTVGPTIGVELLIQDVKWPQEQQEFMKTEAYHRFLYELQSAGLADQRVEGITPAVAENTFRENSKVYSRISHFKLRWQDGRALPAKVYVQIRNELVDEIRI